MHDMPLLVFFLKSYRYESAICNGRHDVLMMVFGLENIAMLNIEGADYSCIIWNIRESNPVKKKVGLILKINIATLSGILDIR